MRFKKIYIEITNSCNLNCDFCIKNKRKIIYMSFDNYKYIIDKIKNYTKEIYLHILGEPLMHPQILDFIEYAYNNNILVNITTNGYLINKLYNCPYIHRLNISIHSYNPKYKISLNEYLDNIYKTIESIRNNTFISLRLWVNNDNLEDTLKFINNKYKTNITTIDSDNSIKITNNLIIDSFHKFVWPDLNNNYYNENGKCFGLINHIGILSNGDVVPCCLDTLGLLKLGNIYTNDIEEILNNNIAKEMIKGFKENKKTQELCKHCKFF